MANNDGYIGPINGTTGPSAGLLRIGGTGEQIVSDAHGRFYEAAVRGTLFSTGMTVTSISNVTFTTATVDATATPIVGVWNPLGSGKNLVILQARIQIVNTALQTTGQGGFVWLTGTGESAISTGLTPLNRLTLTASGSIAKGFANTALTGKSASLSIREASGLAGGPMNNTSFLQTAVGALSPNVVAIENIDGAIIVPPGGVLSLQCTTTPIAISAASSLLWEEVPVLV
jgi:hypothetical protein